MFLWLKLALVAACVAAAWGAKHSYDENLIEKGRAEAAKAVAEAQAEQDRRNLELAQRGEETARELLAKANKRNVRLKELAVADAAKRRAESEARAREDREYALWREQRVPAFVAARLRRYIDDAARPEDRGDVPDGAPVSAIAPVPDASAGSNEQRRPGGIRALLDRIAAAGVEAR